ncbi:MAG TPA: DNA-directed RNA polymerase subunit delta [Syntrophomonadaceae bacterium]|nr:DNA-directed RNA polymerase subunit delta [Syntrophomonadaceae bacterium]
MRPRKKSEADWALEIMKEKEEPIYYDELVKSIAKKMNKKPDVSVLSSIYTRINLDSRLIYEGDGYWFYDSTKIHREE